MQLSVQKHYIQFILKYIPLKYIISVTSTLFKSMLHYNYFSQRSDLPMLNANTNIKK